jgi:thioredoxin 1
MDVPRAVMSKGVKQIDHRSFENLIKSTDKLVIVEFYSDSCEICQAIAPVYEQLSEELADDVVFTKVDAEENLDMALQYGVVGTPTFKLFCRDRFLGEIVGETNETVLRNTIKDMIRHRAGCSPGSKNRTFELDGYG